MSTTTVMPSSFSATVLPVASPQEIVSFLDSDPPPGATPWVTGRGPSRVIEVVAPDPGWPETFAALASRIRELLGETARHLEHVGSTAVPGLAAKPVIDIDLTVPDSADEPAYAPALQRCGFILVVREPWWYEHRCLRLTDPLCNLHVFSPGCAEPERHRIFRDWLRTHPRDRARYAEAKLAASEQARTSGGDVTDYNAHKQAVLRAIYARAFLTLGLTDPPASPA